LGKVVKIETRRSVLVFMHEEEHFTERKNGKASR